uniref:Uncharacterized protein n=1 Tax=Helianthus annuus TaxID=4232 RepID=A0A251T374_HELAN
MGVPLDHNCNNPSSLSNTPPCVTSRTFCISEYYPSPYPSCLDLEILVSLKGSSWKHFQILSFRLFLPVFLFQSPYLGPVQ